MLRIMSNNQWRRDENHPAWAERGEDCSAAVREKGFVRVYRETSPDIIGFQEVSPLMLDFLMRGLQAAGETYAVLWGRDTPILYRQNKLELIDSAFGIYPAECPGYEGCFNNDDTKSWNIAVFREKASGKTLIMCTTHLWWKSDDPASVQYQAGSNAARCYQLRLLIRALDVWQEKYGCPAVLVGDLNCPYHSDPIDLAKAAGFVHANDLAEDYAYPYHGYHACGDPGYEPYTPEPFENAIDHMLVRGSLRVKRFDRYISDAYLPLSDHFPAMIDVM